MFGNDVRFTDILAVIIPKNEFMFNFSITQNYESHTQEKILYIQKNYNLNKFKKPNRPNLIYFI